MGSVVDELKSKLDKEKLQLDALQAKEELEQLEECEIDN